jgi:sugar phosphate isomerase/epimerase
MVKAVSTYLYVRERLHPGILDGLTRSGVQAIEIFAARQHLDYANRKAHVKEIAEWFRGSAVPLNSVHSPLYADYEWGRAGAPPVNIASIDRAGLVEAMDEVKRALEIAEQIPFRFLVQHLGLPNESFSDKKFESAMTSIEHLRAFAKPLGVRILLENIPNELSTPDRLMEMIQTAHFDDVGICFDFGHAHIMGSVPEAFRGRAKAGVLDACSRQCQGSGFASVAGTRNDRLEGGDGIAALRAANAAPVAGTRGRREGESAGKA